MEPNLSEISTQAVALFDKMQRIVEARATPVIESYHKDFYEYDRLILADKFSANARYLWLIHPCGSHLGRIGVVPDHRDMMKAVLNCYANAHAPERMELNFIETNAMGQARIRKINFEDGHKLLQQKDYHTQGNALMHGENRVALIDVKLASGRPGEYAGYVNITSAGAQSLNRQEMIAAVMTSAAMVADQSGSLFTAIKSIQIDGKDADDVLQVIDIPEVVQGQYTPAPVAVQSEDESTTLTPRERA